MSNSQTGQTLVEVIVASFVGILVVSALTFATIFSLRNANFAKTSTQATKLAQEGIERVRTGRDRNSSINGLPNVTDCPAVNSWNGDTTGSSVWGCKIYITCGSGGDCYFKFNTAIPNNLDYLTTSTNFPDSATENIPPFKRAIILSDDSTSYATQKKVTVIVRWTDATGVHESKLTTILRKL